MDDWRSTPSVTSHFGYRHLEVGVLLVAGAIFGIPLFLQYVRQARRVGALPAVLALCAASGVLACAMLLVGLAQAGRVPPQTRYLGAGLEIAFGLVLIERAWSGRTQWDEQLANVDTFGMERRLVQLLGRRYYNVRSFMVGLTFVAVGIRVIFR